MSICHSDSLLSYSFALIYLSFPTAQSLVINCLSFWQSVRWFVCTKVLPLNMSVCRSDSLSSYSLALISLSFPTAQSLVIEFFLSFWRSLELFVCARVSSLHVCLFVWQSAKLFVCTCLFKPIHSTKQSLVISNGVPYHTLRIKNGRCRVFRTSDQVNCWHWLHNSPFQRRNCSLAQYV